ncbi:MAG: ribosome small subunit-dependent GTPase A [Calditrichaceae bacterium]
MKNITKRQQKKIQYFLREKQDRKEKKEIIHGKDLPKYLEKRIPYIRHLAPNLDRILIVSSFVSPPFKSGLIDRFLVLAELEEVEPIICLNKTDLLEDRTEIDSFVSLYTDIGYSTIATSAVTGEGIEELHSLMKGHRSAFAGHSGVGKSSLLNRISPDLEIETGEVSDLTNKGRHTTTSLKIYKLDKDTEVLDLPGIKLIDFIDIHRDEARFYFREFREFDQFCKFRDCLHLTELKCAVKQAVNDGEISEIRYDSYVKFLDSL